ncbi:MAG: hypothetical protein VX438_14085 [Planctomycetota bacterium]|nr:hypothetical protein [Planctomycetota bacterium]
MLRTQFIAVAIDQAYQRRQQDAEGEFYRKIARQGPRNNFKATTQGFYIATATGKLLLYNNNRDPNKLKRLMQKHLQDFRAPAANPILPGQLDARYNVGLPKGACVVRVRARVLGGYPPTTDGREKIFQSALSRDNLWISAAEQEALAQGNVMQSLQYRIARFHLVDNTRGEPPMWKETEVRQLKITLDGSRLLGTVHLETTDGKRGYRAQLRGKLELQGRQLTRCDLVADGEFWGHGPYTQNPPKGRFPLAISFSLADGTDIADRVPPQGSRGWVQGYIR